jgi:AdoMet-dependent heme synthase
VPFTREEIVPHRLRIVAWEITRTCNLFCEHCRASAKNEVYPGELSTDDCFKIVDGIKRAGSPILILSGGEPLLRPDVFDIGKYAAASGLRVVMGTNGTLIDDAVAAKIKAVPISRISVSLDFPDVARQDKFRGFTGAFEAAVAGIEAAKRAGIEVQINCTVTRMNVNSLGDLVDMAIKLGAVAFHPFMLVPTGRGKGLAEKELSPEEYESALKWICAKQKELGEKLLFKPTDAPHYYRIARQCGPAVGGQPSGHTADHPVGLSGYEMDSMTRGCLAGISYCFISHVGKVFGCGYLDVEAGDTKQNEFVEIWENSPLFLKLRDLGNLNGKCGYCEFKRICGGCRARSYEVTGDYLAAEPYCVYQPVKPAPVATGLSKLSNDDKPAIIMIADGSPDPAGLKTLEEFDAAAQREFPGYDIFWAFQGSYMSVLLKRGRKTVFTRAVPILNATILFQRLDELGLKNAAVQFLMMHESSYSRNAFDSVPVGLNIKLGLPFLSLPRNRESLIKELSASFGGPRTATVLVGHGVLKEFGLNDCFVEMDLYLRRNYKNVYACTLHGPPGNRALTDIRDSDAQRVRFISLMMTTSDHVSQEIMGDSPESWKNITGLPAEIVDNLGTSKLINGYFLNSIKTLLASLEG